MHVQIVNTIALFKRNENRREILYNLRDGKL